MISLTRVASVGFAVILFVTFGATVAWHTLFPRDRERIVKALTSELPRCDRVEVFHLDGKTDAAPELGFAIRPYDDFSGILNHTTLKGAEAEEFASIWRSQDLGSYGTLCHYPGYGIRFFRDNRLIFETSLCFQCDNFYVVVQGDTQWQGFNSGGPEGQELLRRLQEIFPESIPANPL